MSPRGPHTVHRTLASALVAGASLVLAACGGGGGGGEQAVTPPPAPAGFDFQLPPGFPQPKADPANPITAEKVALGRFLFYDEQVAFNNRGSCVFCHVQARAFTDGLAQSRGPSGDVHPRNAQSLTNTVYNSRQNWANPNIRTLREQAVAVLLNTTPVELGWSGREQEMLNRFRADGEYTARFHAAFPDDADPYTLNNVASALAAFTATMISGRSAYDRNELSASAQRGKTLFFSEKAECFHCHNGFNLANSVVTAGSGTLDNTEYKNNALYNIPGPSTGYPLDAGNYPSNNQGLYEFTRRPSDMGRFRPPTLRNVALTAPYMHDGSIATLREVIVDHYGRGGRLVSSGPYAGDGALSPLKDPLMIGIDLSPSEVDDLLAFLDSLTDWNFICDPRFGDPFGQIPLHPDCSTR